MSQTTLDTKTDEVHAIVDQMPRFPGCEDIGGSEDEKKKCAEKLMLAFIYSHVKYPTQAIMSNIEGMAIVSFIVDQSGNLTNPKIVRDPGGGCGEEALRIVNLMPKWIPGRDGGNPVNVQFNLPIRFKLEGKIKLKDIRKWDKYEFPQHGLVDLKINRDDLWNVAAIKEFDFNTNSFEAKSPRKLILGTWIHSWYQKDSFIGNAKKFGFRYVAKFKPNGQVIFTDGIQQNVVRYEVLGNKILYPENVDQRSETIIFPSEHEMIIEKFRNGSIYRSAYQRSAHKSLFNSLFLKPNSHPMDLNDLICEKSVVTFFPIHDLLGCTSDPYSKTGFCEEESVIKSLTLSFSYNGNYSIERSDGELTDAMRKRLFKASRGTSIQIKLESELKGNLITVNRVILVE